MSRSERIVQQLGVSQGTAVHRLRKNIMFSFAKRLDEDTCFKCGQKIETADELSIEHKEPWENRSAELFWDLDNIAFSHLKCNKPHTNNGGDGNHFKEFLDRTSKTRNAPEGTAWCGGHRDYLHTDAFHPNPHNASGYASYCKECRRMRKD